MLGPLYLGNREEMFEREKTSFTPMRSLLTKNKRQHKCVMNDYIWNHRNWKEFMPCLLLYPQCLDQ